MYLFQPGIVRKYSVHRKDLIMGILSLYNDALWALEVCAEGHYIFFSSGGMNGIFRVDVENGSIDLLTEIEGFDKMDAVKFSNGIKVENKLFFCPYNANCICEYDLEKNSTRTFYSDQLMFPRVNNVVRFNGNLYMFGKNQNFVTRFDLDKEEIDIMQNEKFCSSYKKGNSPLRDLIIRERFVYFAEMNQIIELNLLTNETEVYFIEENFDEDQACTLAFDGKYFWILFQKKVWYSGIRKRDKYSLIACLSWDKL